MFNDQPMMDDPSMQGQPEAPAMDSDPAQAAEALAPYEEGDNDEMENLIDFALSQANLAKKLKTKEVDGVPGRMLLDEIGEMVVKGYEADEDSRKEWLQKNDEWLKMAMLVREDKSYPWPKASNVKYPLLATAAMQFSARAYPALVPSDGKIVKAKVIPYDPQGTIAQAAERIARHMSYQVLCKMPDWEEEMDKLLMTMAISGICFKKTFHNQVLGTHCSHIVYPENFVVNYHAKSLDKAYRKTEILYYTENEYLEKVRNDEEFLEYELPSPATAEDKENEATGTVAPPVDSSTPHVFLAQHTFYDLDGDGYEEPYIIVVHRDTKQVVRIIARWDQDGVYKNDKGKIVKIVPVEYFTAFPFIPNPDGSIYALGFGLLLGPLNESVNSTINQLIDAGTLNNLQAGFIGKGLRLKMGESGFKPGEWKAVNATGDDLKNSIFPLPTKEPSAVLMNLLQMLITSGNQLASIAEIFVGKMPGQNTPATTTQETVKQGMAVFTAIYKRVYRSLHEEFKKLHRLNRITPTILEDESKVLGIPLQSSDYDDDNYIIPGGDPTGDSESTKMMKVQYVMSLLQIGTINPMAATTWAMQAMEIPNYQNLLMQQQQPDPEEKKMQQEMQMEQQKAQMDAAAKQQEMELKKALGELEMQLQQAKMEMEQTKMAMKLQGDQQKMKMDQIMQAQQMKMDSARAQHDMQANQLKTQMDLQATQQMHQQKIQQGNESHKQKLVQQKEAAKSKPNNAGGSKPKKG
jgi:chaperonin GroES